MYKNLNDNVFDSLLKTAFTEYLHDQFEKEPSKEELQQKHPLPKKELRTAKRLAKRVEYGKPLAVVYLQRACIIILVCICVFAAILATSPKIRASITDTFISWYEKYLVFDFNTDYSPVETEPESATEIETEVVTYDMLEIGYVPEGFELVSADEVDGLRDFVYIDTYGNTLLINISEISLSNTSVDGEYSDYSETLINGNTAYVFYNTSTEAGTVIIGNNQYTITISGSLTKADLIKISEGIK